MARTLDQLLAVSAERFPDRTAVIDPGGVTLCYADLLAESERIAAALKESGVGRAARVGICAHKSSHTVAGIFGILAAGAAYVPVDPTAPVPRAAYIFNNCSVSAVLVERPLLEELGALLNGRTEVIADISPRLVLVRVHPHGPPATDEPELAYILYTSGSTGNPKGVMIPHSVALGFVDWCSEVFEPTENDVFSNHSPFHFDLSILDLFVSIKHGASVVLIDDQLGKQPAALPDLIQRYAITIWYSTPAILRMLLEFGKMERFTYPALRTVLYAGEVFPTKHLRELKKIWSTQPHYNLYGPTETNVCTFYRVPDVIPEDRTEPYPIGGACSHCRTAVMEENHQPAAPGSEGELYVAGSSVMLGYWNLPEQNAKAFYLDSEGTRWYRTGDIVADSEGIFLFRGRRDRMVKRRSYRVELGEIESAFYRHPSVSEAAAIATPDAENGVLITVFYTSSGQRPSMIELKKFCADNLPKYMIPDRFSYQLEIPKTSTDKVDYQRLKQLI